MDVRELLKLMKEKDASDMHIAVGSPPVLRIHGDLQPLDMERITPPIAEAMANSVISEEQKQKFEKENDLDFSFGLPGVSRFRVNAHRQRGTVAISFRNLASEIPSISGLGLPKIVEELASKLKGLVLITGATGSGKSTTLASMIDLINTRRKCHIITIEDPIEYLHSHKKALVEQREVGSDTGSFGAALRHVLRQDPDVILIGEMRDLETIASALTAAETGHLVLATLHTSDAPQSVDRVVDVFPPYQQSQVRMQLSMVLEGVVSQQLLTKKDRKGRIAATEVMVVTTAVRNMIREGKTFQLYTEIETGTRFGMQSLSDALIQLCQKGEITIEEALIRARDPEAFKRKIAQAK